MDILLSLQQGNGEQRERGGQGGEHCLEGSCRWVEYKTHTHNTHVRLLRLHVHISLLVCTSILLALLLRVGGRL